MLLKNKLNILDSSELARMEEKISKEKAIKLFDLGILDILEAGTFSALSEIHRNLFEDIYDFAGKVRTVDLGKGNFRFASAIYLENSLKYIEKMPQKTFDKIIEKYVEMNIAHPFREGNGRSMRIWLNMILKKELNLIIDWNKVDKDTYLLAMEYSPINDTKIKYILKNALTNQINNRLIYMKGIDSSFYYEGYNIYKTEEL